MNLLTQKFLSFTLFTLFFIQVSNAQEVKLFEDENPLNFTSENLFISPNSYRVLSLNESVFSDKTAQTLGEDEVLPKNSSTKLTFPLPDGTEEVFRVVEYSMMESGLAAEFPNLKTYHGVAVKNPMHTIRFDYTTYGLRAVIRHGKETVYIDPADKNNSGNYISYYKRDLTNDNVHSCSLDASLDELLSDEDEEETSAKSASCGLRSYRLAIAATAEYSNYYGATSSAQSGLVLSAIITSINRVNEVFENDLGIRLILINNLPNIFYYNAASDPYSNSDPAAMLNQNQGNISSTFNDGDYDVGHVVATSYGGVAALNSPCNSQHKAKGVTGLPSPQGDAFDVDFLAHELGHQFGAYHTFNNHCGGNINTGSSVETGSGSTIMAYAGSCVPNVQYASDGYFHSLSLTQINAFINGSGNSCAGTVASSNNQPTAYAGETVVIPASTPFFLTGKGTDSDGDVLTYSWEQMDKEVTTQPPLSTASEGPNFRSFLPTTDPVRYIPNLADLSSGNVIYWEILSSVNRDYNFNLTVRDNSTNVAGCFAVDEKVVTVTASAGPFVITSPSATGIAFAEGSRQTITWNVANTDVAPINCENVDILLSTDGGLSFPTVLVKNVKNDGNAEVTIPAGVTTAARIMIKSVENIFFDISDNNFTIQAGSPDFYTSISYPEQKICASDDAVYEVEVGSVGGFTEDVILTVTNAPAGMMVSFGSNPVTAGESTVLSFTGTENANFGSYTPTLNASPIQSGSTGTPKSMDFDMELLVKPNSVTQVTPTNNELDLSLRPTFTWNSAPNATEYELQVSQVPTFATTEQNYTTAATSISLTRELESATVYFWRVRGKAECGGGDWSIPLRFTTHFCRVYSKDSLTVLAGFGDTSSKMMIEDEGNIVSIEVQNVVGRHEWVEDLSATLISPNSTSVVLWENLCGANNDFSVGFRDDAANSISSADCNPLGGGKNYQSSEPLSGFSAGIQGEWELLFNDNYNGIGGELDSWRLKICVTEYAAADALPLDLISFRAEANKETINLQWQTQNEIDIAGFEIERKSEGESRFEVIDFKEGKGAAENDYFLEDNTVRKGINYQYRLRLLDLSGSFSYSEIRNAKIESDEFVFNMFPNPAHDQLNVVLSEDNGDDAILEAYNASGQRVASFHLHAGNNILNISAFNSGIYLLKMQGEDFVGFQKLVVK